MQTERKFVFLVLCSLPNSVLEINTGTNNYVLEAGIFLQSQNLAVICPLLMPFILHFSHFERNSKYGSISKDVLIL
jgi:hypothetical protein